MSKAKYALAGGINTILGMGVFITLSHWLPQLVASLITELLAQTARFVMYRHFVFNSTDKSIGKSSIIRQARKFIIGNSGASILCLGLVSIFSNFLNPIQTALIITPTLAVVGFMINKGIFM